MVWSRLTRYQDAGLLVLRLGVGIGFMLFHGWGKISGGPEAWARTGGAMGSVGIDFYPVFWGFMAAFAEFVCAFLIAIGLFFRPACLLIAITMFVAVGSHLDRGDGFAGARHAFKNFFFFAGLMTIGPGKYSVDYWLTRKKSIV